MSYFVAMLELWCLLFIAMILGRRLVYLLPSVIQRTLGFYVAPILGLAALVLFATLYGWLLPFRWVYSLLLTAIIVLILWVLEPEKGILLRDTLYLEVFAFICSLPILAPLLRYHAYNPLTDIFTYLVQGQWLQHHAFKEKVITSGYYPALTQVALYQASGCRMGGTFFLAYVQSLFALSWSYDAYIPTVASGFVAGCLSIGGVIRQIVPVKKSIILALALLPSLMINGFIFGAEWGFFPQTFGLAFAAGVCALFPRLMVFLIHHSCHWFRLSLYIFPLAVCTSALLFAYNEPFPLFMLTTVLFIFFSRKYTWQLFSYLTLYVIETLVLINYESIRIAKSVYQTLSISQGLGDIGWPILWSPIQFIAFSFGLKSPFVHHLLSVDTFISVILAPFMLLVVFTVLTRFMYAHPKRRTTLSFLFCAEFVLFLFWFKFRYFVPDKSVLEVGHTFLQFKLAKYAAPFSFALLGTCAAIMWHYLDHRRSFLIGIYGVIFVVGLCWHVCIASRCLTEPFLIPFKQQENPFVILLKLRETVRNISSGQVIHVQLGPNQSKLRQMVTYVLYDRKISSDYRDDGYILGHLPPQDANMPLGQANGLIVMKGTTDNVDLHSQEVGPFLIQKPPFHYLMIGKQEGGYHTESNKQGDTWNWVPHAIDVPFCILGASQKVKIKFQIETHYGPRTFRIEFKNEKGALLAAYTLHSLMQKKYFESQYITIHGSKKLLLHVEADGQPARLTLKDQREAAFMIKNIAIVDSRVAISP